MDILAIEKRLLAEAHIIAAMNGVSVGSVEQYEMAHAIARLRAELECVAARITDAEQAARNYSQMWADARAELSVMTGKRDRLRDALKEYGRHKNGCWVPCNCGFDDALDEAIDAALAADGEK